jgi:RNA-binding protein YhbY
MGSKFNMTSRIEIQLGKKGLTPEFLGNLKKRFEKPGVKNIKISVLQSARKSKADVKNYAEDIIKFLGNKFTYRTIGFSIFVLKMRKEQR